MSRSTAEIVREYGPFSGADNVHGVTYDGQNVWFAAGDKLNAFDPASGKSCARSMSPRMQERPSTASTCFSSPRIASRKSTRRPAVCSPRSRRPAAAVTRGSRGPKGRSGWGSIGTGRSIKSIPRQARFFARSSPTASSPGSPGSTESCGTAPGKVTRVICGESILERERFWRALEMPPGVGVSGLESDGGDLFFCGGGRSGKVRTVRRPKRGSAPVRPLG